MRVYLTVLCQQQVCILLNEKYKDLIPMPYEMEQYEVPKFPSESFETHLAI